MTKTLVHRILKKAIEPLKRRNYPLARALYLRRMRQRIAQYDKSPLLILTMGKVGTKTVHVSLDKANIGRCIYETHHLSDRFINILEKDAKKRFRTDSKPAEYAWKCRYLADHFRRENSPDRWKVITMVRDPVSRNISNFFENINAQSLSDGAYRVSSRWHGFDIVVRNDSISELISLFFTKFNHRIHESYFDRNFRDVIGIDLFAEPFPKDIGYKIYHHEKADVLLLTLERLHNTACDAFHEFLGLENCQLQNSNTTVGKGTAEVYRWFKSSIRFTESYLDEMYSSRYVQQFYLTAEINAFRKQWVQ